jgi:hypothetical protein
MEMTRICLESSWFENNEQDRNSVAGLKYLRVSGISESNDFEKLNTFTLQKLTALFCQ